MEIEEIKKLLELMEEKGVVELEVKNRKGELRLVRENHRASVPPPQMFQALSPASMPDPPVMPEIPGAKPAEESASPHLEILSPMVGTFYRAANPEAPAYVDIGSTVEKGEVVCIIEAMKMMNEIQAEKRGRVLKVLVENGQPVEYGQLLFVLEPL